MIDDKFIVGYVDNGSIKKIIESARNGDIKALNEIITYGAGIVFEIVYGKNCKFANFKDKEDLFSEGILAFYEATINFNLSSNVKFSFYAYRYILEKMFAFVKNNTHEVSIEAMIEDGTIANYLPYLNGYFMQDDDFIDNIEDKDIIKRIINSFSCLTKKELEFLSYKLGLDGNEPLSSVQVAEAFGISRQYVSSYSRRAFEKIRQKCKTR